MRGYYNQVAALLRQHDFVMVRHSGTAHQTWKKGNVSVTVSTNCASRHTANSIMKDAGIAHRF